MKKQSFEFVVVGSGGGGGTVAWMLAKAGHSVQLLEQGSDLAAREFSKPAQLVDPAGFNSATHNEFRYRTERPDPKRRPRGDYNTFRRNDADVARPFGNGWTGSVLGGGSVIWGTWAFRGLPADFELKRVFEALNPKGKTPNQQWGYSVENWPVTYGEMEPYYNVAEALLAVSGSHEEYASGIQQSPWFAAVSPLFPGATWGPRMPFPCMPYPVTPVGRIVWEGMRFAGLGPIHLPTAIVSPGSRENPFAAAFRTREALGQARGVLASHSAFWKQSPEALWSDRVRLACNMCGYCGEFLCWGGARRVSELGSLMPGAPKSGTHSTVLQELRDMEAAGKPVRVTCNAKVYEIVHDRKAKRARGVKWLNVSDPNKPKPREESSAYVIVSCGAVQSARLLHMSGPPAGLGNSRGQLGRHVTFHLFGLGAKAVFKADTDVNKTLQGALHGNLGHTGNVTSFAPYFMKDPRDAGSWIKGGTLTSTAKKNPLENIRDKAETFSKGSDYLKELDRYNRSIEVRLTGDDLSRPQNRVDLDPANVDEYGFPVARITREVGPHEWRMYEAAKPQLEAIFKAPAIVAALDGPVAVTPHIPDLVGDHQMGTCRMGATPKDSVLDSKCRLWEAPNVFVVDSSFMPTGLGLNPMVTVVANALRVGTFIADTLAKKGDPTQ